MHVGAEPPNCRLQLRADRQRLCLLEVMDVAFERVLRSHLAANEKLLWCGRPLSGLRLRASDGYAIPFSLMWAGFAIFWELSVFKTGAPAFFKLWGIPFVLVGLYLIIGRFFVEAWLRSRTYYALTNERAIIVTDHVGQTVKSLPLRTLSDVMLIERRDRSGSIALGRTATGWVASGWIGSNRYPSPPAFDLIENVGEVFTLLLRAQTNAMKVSA
jgi:hypothetical protein